MISNPYASYKKQSVSTMTTIEIVVKMYNEIERELNRGILFIEQNNTEEANNALNRALEIFSALRSVLDLKIPIGKNLDALYNYFGRQITEANLKKDAELVKEILPMVAELKDAFTQVAAMSKEELAAQEARNNRN